MKKRVFAILLSAALVMGAISPGIVRAEPGETVMKEIWVDPVSGSDGNDGSPASPFQSLERARQEAAVSAADMTGNVIVHLHGGEYSLDGPVTFGSGDSGTNGYRVIYRAAEGESPVFSGGKRVTGWTLHDAEKQIYAADVPAGCGEARQFYVDGVHWRRAMSERSPVDWEPAGSAGYMSPETDEKETEEYVILDLGEEKPISRVTLYPSDITDADGRAAGFPEDFTIETSADGEEYTVRHTETAYAAPAPGSSVEFCFEEVPARYVKLRVTKLGTSDRLNADKYMLALSEMEVGREGSEVSAGDLPLDRLVHVDTDRDVMADVSESDISLSKDQGFPLGNLMDKTTEFITSTSSLDPGLDGGCELTIGLGQPVSVTALSLHPRLSPEGQAVHEPVSFEIMLERDGEWTTVRTVEDFAWGDRESALFSFAPAAASSVKLRVSRIGHGEVYEENTYYRFQLSELEIFRPADLALHKPVEAENSWEYPEGDLGRDYLTSGVQDGMYTSFSDPDPSGLQAEVTVDLEETRRLGGVRLYPRGGGIHYPADMKIAVSEDGGEYTELLRLSNIPDPGDRAQLFVFPEAADARYIRLIPTRIGRGEDSGGTEYYRFQLRGIEAVPAGSSEGELLPEQLATQAGAGATAQTYGVQGVTALHDNPAQCYAADKLTDGILFEKKDKTGFLVPESYQLANYGNLEDLEIHILRWWYHNIIKVEGLAEGGRLLKFDPAQTPYATLTSDRPTWIENAYDLIDTPGEWYIDKQAGRIYCKSEQDMEGREAVLPLAEELLHFGGCRNVSFEGVVFEYTSWTEPGRNAYSDAQSGTYVVSNQVKEVPGGIQIVDSSGIEIRNCELRNFGGGGIRITGAAENNKITGSRIHDISSGGVWVGTMHGHGTPCTAGTLKNNEVSNNYVTRVGVDYFDSSGITVLYTQGTVVEHNEISYCPYTGVSLGWGWDFVVAECTGNNVISHNYIHNIGKVQHDGAAIYTLGSQSGSKIHDNYVHTYHTGTNDKDAGLYLDEGSCGIELYNNVVGDGVYWWSTMWTSSIHDNHWHDNYHQGRNERDNGTDNIVENNTLVEDGDFSRYPAAQAVIDAAGPEEAVKEGVTEGLADPHRIALTMYPDSPAYYISRKNGLQTLTIPGQIGETQYDWLGRKLKIMMPEGTDLTSLVPVYTAESGFTGDIPSGSTGDFTGKVIYTFSNGDLSIPWEVSVIKEVTTQGEPQGTLVSLDDAVETPSDWTVAPETAEDGVIFRQAKSFSGYIRKRIPQDGILAFDMESSLKTGEKDWLGYALRVQDPYDMLGTMYHVCLNCDSVELQRWAGGRRTMLYGTIPGYTPVFGDLTNEFYKPDRRHSIRTGAIDVPTGVRLFLYIDGNKVFDVIDTEDYIRKPGFFSVYPMTQDITLRAFSNIGTTPPGTGGSGSGGSGGSGSGGSGSGGTSSGSSASGGASGAGGSQTASGSVPGTGQTVQAGAAAGQTAAASPQQPADSPGSTAQTTARRVAPDGGEAAQTAEGKVLSENAPMEETEAAEQGTTSAAADNTAASNASDSLADAGGTAGEAEAADAGIEEAAPGGGAVEETDGAVSAGTGGSPDGETKAPAEGRGRAAAAAAGTAAVLGGGISGFAFWRRRRRRF